MMLKKSALLVSCVLLLIGFAACDNSKTIVVSKKPVFPGEQVPLTDFPSEVTQEVIRIGELNKVESLDPLFASNNGELRILNLVYDGLVQLDSAGKIRPSIANSWKISADSLTYEFYLGDKRFHDSDLFLNGLGREITASDVRFAFERMAQAQVPPHTARLFWAIRGFDSYFQEQHEIYQPEKRTLKQVSGIEIPDEKTVIFKLDYKDAHFIHKLAKPEASIYPAESVQSKTFPIGKWPIGSDKWKFSGLFRDSIITIRPVDQSTNLTNEIKRKRVEFYFFESEVALYKKFFLNEIDLVPELGPQLSKTILKTDGTLNEVYRDRFSLFTSVSTQPYYLFFNPNNRFGIQIAEALASVYQSNLAQTAANSPIFERIELGSKSLASNAMPSFQVFSKSSDKNARLVLSFNNDKIALELLRYYYLGLNSSFHVTYLNSPIQGRETVFFVNNQFAQNQQGELMATIYVKRSGLQKSDRTFATFSSEPWWIQLDTK